jgi:hypothetical protein
MIKAVTFCKQAVRDRLQQRAVNPLRQRTLRLFAEFVRLAHRSLPIGCTCNSHVSSFAATVMVSVVSGTVTRKSV